MQDVLREILKSQAHVAAGLIVFWMLIGVVLGLIAGVLAFLGLLKSGALRLDGTHAPWFRILSAVLVIGAGACFGGSIGGCEGTLRGTERIVRESQFRTEGLRRAGEAVAGALVWSDFALVNHFAGKEPTLREEQVAAVDAFLKSGREFDLRAFQERLGRTEAEFVRKISDSAGADVRARMGLAPGGVPDRLLLMSLGFVMDYGVRKTVRGQIDKHGLRDGVDGLFGALDTAGKLSGDPATASMPELAEAIVDRSLIPLLLTPAKSLVRAPQLTSAILMLGAFLLPALGFWIGRKVQASRVPH